MRNLKKEVEWRKNNYKRIDVTIKKDKAERFFNLLKEENKTFNGWVNNQIDEFLEKNKK